MFFTQKVGSQIPDLNWKPSVYKTDALPIVLIWQKKVNVDLIIYPNPLGREAFKQTRRAASRNHGAAHTCKWVCSPDVAINWGFFLWCPVWGTQNPIQ